MSDRFANWSADLYKGAYGLTLRLGIPSDNHLNRFKETLRELASGSTTRLTLENESQFVLTGLNSVLLLLSPEAEKEKTVFVVEQTASRRVEWRATPSQWRLFVELLEGFTGGVPAHQYLSKEGVDDALIEVAYLEG